MKLLLGAACVALAGGLMTACTQDETEGLATGKLVPMTFTAGTAQTRTALGDDGMAVNWTLNDKVAIWDGTYKNEFTATTVDGSNATLEGEAQTAESYTAFYPYAAVTDITHDAITFTLPAEQTATAGGFAEGLNPSWAQATGGSNQLQFHNLCALVKFTVDDSGLDGVQSLTLEANTDGHALAGSLTYTIGTDGSDGTLAANDGASQAVTLKGSFKAGETYYFVVAPGTLTGGITLSYTDSSNGLKYLKTTSNAVTLTAGHILNLGTVTFQPEAITNTDFITAVGTQVGWTKEANGTVLLTAANKQAMAGVTILDVCGKKLTSLAGIEYFTGLTILYCDTNNLTSLDVTGLTNLEKLSCYGNQLTSLDVSGLANLTTLECYNNNLTSLDVTGLTNLENLYCYNNNLTELDVTGLTNLITLLCYSNNLTSLDVTTLSNLNMLKCGNQKNNITLDLYLTSAQQSNLTLSWYTENGNITQHVQ